MQTIHCIVCKCLREVRVIKQDVDELICACVVCDDKVRILSTENGLYIADIDDEARYMAHRELEDTEFMDDPPPRHLVLLPPSNKIKI